uniref:Photosystem II reaction center Psb28 protein n=1 Tax=Calcidiscus leptoporus TaxID=127549 RepID=A0A7S0P7R2_9EUKA|mmetsp:Transcript_9169/g.21282  ORF Transcript_9169/g.21282 Transcript_9169/m.21282 type:complete len:201 (+) Transcript_9169:26-628(+)
MFHNLRMLSALAVLALLPLAATWSVRGVGCGPTRCVEGRSACASTAASTRALTLTRTRALTLTRMAEELVENPVAAAPAAPSAYIEFILGVPEPVVPDVKLSRARDGSNGVATFTFDNPSFLAAASAELGETTGMYLNDSEGQMRTNEVTATFVNGKPRIVKGVMVLRGPDEWDRFMRFMERYAEENGLGFSKAGGREVV